MAKSKEKEAALLLRKNGASIKNIAKKILVSQSTVSYWCRDIVLTKEQITKLKNNQITSGILTGEKLRKNRIERTKKSKAQGATDVSNISKRDLFILGLGLYWGEGYKQGSQEFGFTNKDPFIILYCIKWLKEIYNVDKKDIIARVSINSSEKSREKEIIDYWCKVTKIKPNQFTKTSFIKTKSKKVYENKKFYFGTLRIKTRRSTDLRRRILGSLEKLEKLI